jgi:hypothetical protein
VRHRGWLAVASVFALSVDVDVVERLEGWGN